MVAERCRQCGGQASAIELDVEDFAAHEPTVNAIIREFGRIDVLINNAGRSQRALAEETPLDVDRSMFNLNFFAVVSFTKAVLPHMIRQRSGHIMNTSSVAGKTGSPCSATYAATKAALQLWSDSLRMEVTKRHNILVTNVNPGPVQSEISLHSFTDKPGEKLNRAEDQSSKMTAERCARLMVGGLWAGLTEIWPATQPILFFTYLNQYCPLVAHWLAPSIGAKRVAAFKAGGEAGGYGSIWRWVCGGTRPGAGEAKRA